MFNFFKLYSCHYLYYNCYYRLIHNVILPLYIILVFVAYLSYISYSPYNLVG